MSDNNSENQENNDKRDFRGSFLEILKRANNNKKAIALGAVAVGAIAYAAPYGEEAYRAVAEKAPWSIAAIAGSEVMWNTGAVLMLASTGARIAKNPLKIRGQFKNAKQSLAEATNTGLFKVGMGANIAGELGTASTIVGVSVAELPMEVWPMTMGASVGLAIPSVIAWKGIYEVHKAGKKQGLGSIDIDGDDHEQSLGSEGGEDDR